MTDKTNSLSRRDRAIIHMRQALNELNDDEDALIAMRLQLALDVALRQESGPAPGLTPN